MADFAAEIFDSAPLPLNAKKLDDGEIGLGVIADRTELEEGEVMMYSKGGASVILKNNGKVLINGEEY